MKYLTSLRCHPRDQTGKVLGGVIRNSKHLKMVEVGESDDSVCDLLEQVVNPSKCSLEIADFLLNRECTCTLTSVGTAVDTLVPSITHKTLRRLELRGIRLTPAAAAALGRSLPEMSSLETLKLIGADGSIEAEEMEALFGGFNKTLPLYILAFSGFSVSGCLAPLAKSFRFFPNLRNLYLDEFNMDERKLVSFAGELKIHS
ncbi:hypothetical protein OS493_020580 [Desmophyllum pertusum]|uniref:Uncharacterized protein n=1 Tax=Desmophyllum pertusum TaxID=174260 RepID=A0A9W9Z0M4_9CNID|nr:hypothetical protein OS493_020580 [Desmophyllum pertusum]